MWGYIYQQNIAPVCLGEFGTKLTDPKDAPWLKAITAYLGGDFNNDGTSRHRRPARRASAGPTGRGTPTRATPAASWPTTGQTVNQNKIAYLTPIEFDFGSDAGGGGGTRRTSW